MEKKLSIEGHLEDGGEDMITIIWILETCVARIISE
jgi:hypothetical protein